MLNNVSPSNACRVSTLQKLMRTSARHHRFDLNPDRRNLQANLSLFRTLVTSNRLEPSYTRNISPVTGLIKPMKSTGATDLNSSTCNLLSLLAAQPPCYGTIHIHSRPYLLTEGDKVRLPFRMPGVSIGDTLRLTCASLLGSRDYTVRGFPFMDERFFECRAVVSGIETEPMRFKTKTKKRNRKVKVVKSKHRYTEITISKFTVKDDP